MEAVAKKKVTYDLSRFDSRKIVKEEAKKERISSKQRNTAAKTMEKQKFAMSGFAVFSSVIVFIMLIALLFSYVNLTESSDINRRRRAELEDLHEEIQMLEVSRNQRMGALQVRDWAVTKLGMSKIDKSQITYVSTSGGDRFEVGVLEPKSESKLVAGLAKGFSTIVEYIN